MIHARHLRDLTLLSPAKASRALHLSAASGLVAAGEFLYAVADDELHLGVFPRHGNGHGSLLRLFPGDLPPGHRERKAAKPDLEVLTRLPPFAAHPFGALLALGSGSRPQRRRGALLALDADGAIAGTPRALDLSATYAALEGEFPALNIEGAVVTNDELVLLQRGSGARPVNALLRFALVDALQAFTQADAPGRAHLLGVQHIALGEIDDVPLGFTDGAALPDGRIVFSAAAENTPDCYQDGPCAGAAIGILGCEGELQCCEPLQPTCKVEGLHAWLDEGLIQLLMVTDADDERIAGRLLAAEFPSVLSPSQASPRRQ